MADGIVGRLQDVARAMGMEITRARPAPVHPLLSWFRRYDVQFLLDVGANSGQACEYFRSIGYAGPILSIEPLKQQFEKLRALAEADGNILPLNYGVGASSGEAEIHVSGGSAVSSSFREMSDVTIVNAPEQLVVGKQLVEMTTLDEIVKKYCPCDGAGFMKLDVQGYEKEVLEGGRNALDRIVGIRIEMSLVENYIGETLLYEMMPKLYELGFRLVDISPVWRDLQGEEIFQLDGTLFRVDQSKGEAAQ